MQSTPESIILLLVVVVFLGVLVGLIFVFFKGKKCYFLDCDRPAIMNFEICQDGGEYFESFIIAEVCAEHLSLALERPDFMPCWNYSGGRCCVCGRPAVQKLSVEVGGLGLNDPKYPCELEACQQHATLLENLRIGVFI